MNNYIIIKIDGHQTAKHLQLIVNQKISEGYIPTGGIAVWQDELYGRCMMQAMVFGGDQ